MTRTTFLRTFGLAALLLAPGPLAAAQQPAATQPVQQGSASPQTKNLQILLLSAALKPGSAGPEIPENAQKALADLKKFLPFKSYQLIDAAWLSATEMQEAQGRLAGSAGAAYKVELRFRTTTDGGGVRSLFMDHFQTTFSIKEGETIVVGSSKADGADGALVVLLTAMPAS